MKKQLCKTLRTMANKLPDETYEANGRRITNVEDETGQPTGEKQYTVVITRQHPVNHYRRLKRLLVKGGTQAVKIYFDKHKAA